MKIANRAAAGFVLPSLCLASCVSTNPAKTVIPEEEVWVDHLYGYEMQTAYTGKKYLFSYGDIRVEGTVTRFLNPAVPGITTTKIVLFRGNAEYTVDLEIGDDALFGKIKVENDTYTYDLLLNDKVLNGTSSFGRSENVYALDAQGLTTEELAIFFLVNLLKTIQYDMHRYHTR